MQEVTDSAVSVQPIRARSRLEVTDSAIPVERTKARLRLDSIDVLRGLVMAIMAIDHVRDFLSHDLMYFDPTDLTKTHGTLFLTRWITHFCASVFCFLAGTGAFLSFSRGKTKGELSNFLLTRGLWLVLLEVTVVQFGWLFHFEAPRGAGVIWALGWSMVALSAVVYLPLWAVGAFGIVMIAGHNLLDPIPPSAFGSLGWLWNVLHVPGEIRVTSHWSFFVAYPLIPWIGVMAAGYAFGAIVKLEPTQRRKWLLWLGLGVTAAFVVIRAANVYGDPLPWSPQASPLFTVFSFLNCHKYPPSLLYLLMTLGPPILFLWLLDGEVGKLWRPFIVFGRVPLFFYLLHIYLIHLVALITSYVRHGGPAGLFAGPVDHHPTLFPADYGFGLAGVYAAWLLVVISLYPLCRWFAELKQRRRDVWLSYL
ncbi:MAG: DUF1624 domain-containing protein [Chthoniobacterales bacterium]|nr:DUF1624 domain-containing protein [Chthoniobacterales bacterium]